jgi:hypothetical protein
MMTAYGKAKGKVVEQALTTLATTEPPPACPDKHIVVQEGSHSVACHYVGWVCV